MEERVREFLNFLEVERRYSNNTITAYENDLLQFLDFLKKESKEPINDWNKISRERILDFLIHLKEKGYSAATLARKIAAIRSFFSFLYREEVISENPVEEVKGPKPRKHLPKVLTFEEILLLLEQPSKMDGPEAKRDKAILELLYASGLRVSELVSLDLDDVNLEEGYIRCVGKGFRQRFIPIHNKAIKALEEYLKEARPKLAKDRKEKALFLNRQGRRLTRQGIWLLIKNYAKMAGIREKDLSPHVLRHSVATHLLHSHKMNLRELQEFLGHASISSTQIYTHITSDHIRKVYEETHPRAK